MPGDKNMNGKSKLEQLFVLIIFSISVLGVFLLSGCGGGKSCEKPKCGNEEFYGGETTGVSIPGCGGCLSSGKGCNSCLWAQSCKVSCAKWENSYTDDSGKEMTEVASVKGCDTRYFGDGCLGCAQQEKSSYLGYITYNEEGESLKGFFYGSSDSEEKFIGCNNGCGGCVADGGIGSEMLKEMETVEGIN